MTAQPVARYNLAIVGSGGAAFAAAIAARRTGRTVVMIDRGTVGGTTGCTRTPPCNRVNSRSDGQV